MYFPSLRKFLFSLISEQDDKSHQLNILSHLFIKLNIIVIAFQFLFGTASGNGH